MTAFISVGGNKEKIDDFCGSGTPRELMSNSAVMSLHFHSTAVSRGSRGFKARYSFVSSITTTSIHLFKVEIHFRSLNSLFFFFQISESRPASKSHPVPAPSDSTAPRRPTALFGAPISRDSTRATPSVTTSSTPRSASG